MKTTRKTTLAVLVLATAGFVVQAQDNGGPPEGGPQDGGPPPFRRPPPLPLVLVLDTNHDGVIDSNEIANASAELLTLDKNHDGQLTPDEYLPPLPPGADSQTFRPPPSPLIEALDTNHDGIIDSNEIANAPAELRTLDKNGDGKLTRDEYCPPRPQGMGGPPDGDDSSGGPPGPPPDNGDSPNGGPPGPAPNQ